MAWLHALDRFRSLKVAQLVELYMGEEIRHEYPDPTVGTNIKSEIIEVCSGSSYWCSCPAKNTILSRRPHNRKRGSGFGGTESWIERNLREKSLG